jgi:hypothetical protein
MMTGYLKNWNTLPPAHPAYTFQPPHPGMDAVSGDLIKHTESVASIHTFCDHGGIVNLNGHCITRMKPVNDVVTHCSILLLNQEIQTIFVKPKPVKDNGESESAQDQEKPQVRGADANRLLSVSDLEYIGLTTSYLCQTREENPLYTMTGQPIALPICHKVQRSISILLG